MGKIEMRVFCKTTKEKKQLYLKTNLDNQVENMKEKRIKNKISSLGYFQVELKEKKYLYKEKKMYKKIEKSSKICLCMIKKTSSPPPHKKSPKKKKPPPPPTKNTQKKKKKKKKKKKS